ncbi:MAG: 4-(cytidine 5'-diphospho)-2-C-methyl-D-erythritol kinase [Polaromonas sp.]|nr:4-(cytidine 5'-diphospho)-2-C-methyl-D-erythritol kinase [Polaromonas sp.]
MKAIYDVPAPAKLNLFLHITGRRPDGYHLIQSVFMLIDWYDTLHFELRTDGQITRADIGRDSANILPAKDLTVRAAKALQKATGTTLGAHISLEKRIPSQAGMGGGSSDAASCLLSLQRLWGVKLPRQELLAIALSLGADVPFFMFGGNAWVEGVGELLTPIDLPSADFLVLKPPLGVSTPTIFASQALKRNTETATMLGFAANEKLGNRLEIFGFGHNDLQPVAQELCPQISQSLDWLASKQLKGRMTGSGSAVFAHLPYDLDISGCPDSFKVRKCSNLQAHPLVGW